MRIRLEDLLGGDREPVLIGIDVRTVGYEAFAAVRPEADRQETVLRMLRHLAALEEFVLLVTCNRLEVYAWSRMDESLLGAVRSVLGLETVADDVYVKRGEDVLTHAANVVAGHLSEVVCETQITAQFKAAFRRAFDANVAGVHMQNLHDTALRLAKRVRGMHGVSRDGLAEQVKSRVASGNRVLLLGAGHLGRDIAERLEPGFIWANRTVANIPATPECERTTLDDARERLGEVDVVVSVVGSGRPVIRAEHVQGLAKPPVFIDLGMPRNVDAAVRDRSDTVVVTLEDFRTAPADREQLESLTKSVAAVLHG
jgi:glutamyl-tRNA reductase